MNTITYGHKVAGVGIQPIPPFMVAKEFDSTADTRMSSDRSPLASPEAEPPPARLEEEAPEIAMSAAS